MSFFSYNYYKTLKRPDVYLSYPNGQQIGRLTVRDFQTDIMGNSANKGTFKVYRYEDKKRTLYYDMIKIGMYLYMGMLKWFMIKEVNRKNNGYNEYLEVTYVSLEYSLGKTILTSFGSLGIDTDDQGGLDRYCLYNPLDTDHSIMHIVVQKNPSWSIGYIDPDISTEYRNFQIDSIDTYSFLTSNVSKAYECIFQFQSGTKEISAYKLENIGADTNITLGYRNFVKSIDQKADDSDIKTVLTVSGGNDARTNIPLGIIDVNISGTNQIYDFTYFLHMMSPELQEKLQKYEKKCSDNTPSYQERLSQLGDLYNEYYNLTSHAPDSEGSTNWGEYGLAELQTQEKIYLNNMSLYLGKDDAESKALYNSNKKIHDAVEEEITIRKNDISLKETAINNCKNQISSLIVKIDEFLGEKLYNELSLYVSEDTLIDDSFIATTIMTDAEILEMQQALLKHARSELSKVCYPKFETSIDLINFTIDYSYKEFTSQMDMFNVVHIRFEEQDALTDARLLKLHINWDDPTDFTATFSNRNSLDETFGMLKEIIEQTESNSQSLSYGVGAWANAAKESPAMREYMSSIFDASKQMLQSSEKQDVTFGESGLLIRKKNDSGIGYDPGQLWATNGMIAMTRDGWNNVSMALGYTKLDNDYFYGLCCESLVGKFILSSNLYISNESGTYTTDKNGMIAKNGSYQVKINPNTPSDIFAILIDNKKLLYVDATQKNLKFEGDIESTTGHIANYVISGSALISGGVGMCSDTDSDAIAFWAGNTNRSLAPFRVTNSGKANFSDIVVTGGDISWGAIPDADSKVTTITKDTVTTSYVNALNIKAGSVDAENITGTTITGKTISAGIIIGTVIKGAHIESTEDIKFSSSSEGIVLGNFKVDWGDGRQLFGAIDGDGGLNNSPVGMSAAGAYGNEYYLWAGWHNSNNVDFYVNASGDVYVQFDITLRGRGRDGWVRDYSVCEMFDHLYDETEALWSCVGDLQDQISSI